jgi:hypothetical protein
MRRVLKRYTLVGGFGEFVDQGGGGGVADPAALLAGGQAQAYEQVGLAGAGVTECDDRLAGVNPRPGSEGGELGGDAGDDVGPVVGQPLEARESGFSDAAGTAAAGAIGLASPSCRLTRRLPPSGVLPASRCRVCAAICPAASSSPARSLTARRSRPRRRPAAASRSPVAASAAALASAQRSARRALASNRSASAAARAARSASSPVTRSTVA